MSKTLRLRLDEDECLELSGTCTSMEGEEFRKGWRCRTTTGTCDTIYHCFVDPCDNAVCADGETCEAEWWMQLHLYIELDLDNTKLVDQ